MTTTYIQLTEKQLAKVVADAVAETIKAGKATERTRLIGRLTYYTAEQTAKMIGVTVETVRKYSRQGRLKKRGGKSTAQYHIDDIELFVWQKTGTKVS